MEFLPDQAAKEEPADANADSDSEAVPAASDLEALNSLTGIPVMEDELLFAVPVVAPYNTFANYKYVSYFLMRWTRIYYFYFSDTK